MLPHPYKILVVDDDKAFLGAITALLKLVDEDIVVETAPSGEEGLKRIKRSEPSLVLLDIGMKSMNGLVTLRFIKSVNPTTLVYFLSGHPEEAVQDAVRMVPADGYFTKTRFVEMLKNEHSLEKILNAGKTEK